MKSTMNQFREKAGNVSTAVVGGLVLVVVLVLLLVNSLYIVNEWQQAVVTRFGEVVAEPVTEAGLHFKMPYYRVQLYDKRLMRLDGSSTSAITRDRKRVQIDVTARWRIEDARRFRETINTEANADQRLFSIIDEAVRNQIGQFDLYQVIRSSNRILEVDEEFEITLDEAQMEEIEMEELATLGAEVEELEQDEAGNFLSGRPVVIEHILEAARVELERIDLGIHLQDILIKQLNYTTEIEETVFAQMNAELNKISAGIRSHGQRRAEERLGEMERELATISSRAQERAERIRGQAEAEATRTYAEAYNRDPHFYQFLRTLESYDRILGANSTLVIGTDSPLYGLFKDLATMEVDLEELGLPNSE